MLSTEQKKEVTLKIYRISFHFRRAKSLKLEIYYIEIFFLRWVSSNWWDEIPQIFNSGMIKFNLIIKKIILIFAGTKKMEYKTRQWHEKCFCCCVCKTPIGTKSFIPREQDIYCAGCYEDKFATRCIKCKKVCRFVPSIIVIYYLLFIIYCEVDVGMKVELLDCRMSVIFLMKS